MGVRGSSKHRRPAPVGQFGVRRCSTQRISQPKKLGRVTDDEIARLYHVGPGRRRLLNE